MHACRRSAPPTMPVTSWCRHNTTDTLTTSTTPHDRPTLSGRMAVVHTRHATPSPRRCVPSRSPQRVSSKMSITGSSPYCSRIDGGRGSPPQCPSGTWYGGGIALAKSAQESQGQRRGRRRWPHQYGEGTRIRNALRPLPARLVYAGSHPECDCTTNHGTLSGRILKLCLVCQDRQKSNRKHAWTERMMSLTTESELYPLYDGR